MKVLSIGSDRKLFEEGSSVALRNIEYGKEMEEMHIVVFSLASNGLKEKKLSSNVTIYPTNSFSKLFYVWDAISLGKKIVLNNKFIRGESVITCQDPFESGLVGWRISSKFRLPLHLQVHTDFLSPYFQNSVLQKVRVAIAKFLLPKANYIRVVSKRIIDSVNKEGIHLQHEPRVLPIRINTDVLNENKPEPDIEVLFPEYNFKILMVSRLTEEKRISDALKAFSEVLKSQPYAGLIIVGDGPLKNKLEGEVKSLKIQDNVVFLGWRDDVFQLMKSSNMFLSTSAYEGYGMSIIEAGLAKCPVLTTNVGISSDILVHKRNSYICPVGDIMCLQSGIEGLLMDNGLRMIMAQNLALDIESLIPTKEEYIRKYVSLLEEAKK